MRNTSSLLSLLKPVICFLIISSLALAVFMGMAMGHSASESGGNASGHEDHASMPWPYHFFMVSLGGVAIVGGWLTAWRMRKRKGWMALHKRMALLGAGFVLIGISIAFYMVSTHLGTYFTGELHTYLGASVFAFVIITPMLGFLQFRLKGKWVHSLHRWSGRATIVLIFATFTAGLLMMYAE